MTSFSAKRHPLLSILSLGFALVVLLAVLGCSSVPDSSQNGGTATLTVGRVELDYPSAWGEAESAGDTIVSGYAYADAKIACDGPTIKKLIWNVSDDSSASGEEGDSSSGAEHLIVGGSKTSVSVPWEPIVQRARDAMSREEQLDDMLEILTIDGTQVIKVTSTTAGAGEGEPALHTALFMFERDGVLGESIMVARYDKGQGGEDFDQIVKDIVASMRVGTA